MLGFTPLASSPLGDDGGVVENRVFLVGVGSFSALAALKTFGFASLEGQGSASFSIESIFSGSSNLSGQGSVSYVGDLTLAGRLDVSGQGSSSFVGGLKFPAFSALSGQGTAAFAGGFKQSGASDIQAEGIFSAVPHLFLGGRFESSVESPNRETESGDTRITEGGDTRIADGVDENSGISFLIADATYFPFDSTVYVNVSSVWKTTEIYANFNGQWVEPQKTYQRISGQWKRIN